MILSPILPQKDDRKEMGNDRKGSKQVLCSQGDYKGRADSEGGGDNVNPIRSKIL